MSRGTPSTWLVIDRPALAELSALYDGWLCRAATIDTCAPRTLTTALGASPPPDAPPEFIWASHPS